MNALFEPFQYEFMRKALLGCVLIGFTNGYLSGFVVLRRHALLRGRPFAFATAGVGNWRDFVFAQSTWAFSRRVGSGIASGAAGK